MKFSKKEIDKLILEELKNALHEANPQLPRPPDLDQVFAAADAKKAEKEAATATEPAAAGGEEGGREETSREKTVARGLEAGGMMDSNQYYDVLEKTLMSGKALPAVKAKAFERLLSSLKVPNATGIAQNLKTVLLRYAAHGKPKGVTYRKK